MSRLQLRLDCSAINGESNENDARRGGTEQSGQGRDVIFSQRIQNLSDPFIAVSTEQDEESPHVFAIWEVEVTLNRPRVRLVSPTVIFSAVGSIKSSQTSSTTFTEEVLPAFKPTSPNVLEEFKADPAMKDKFPFLSSLTLDRILPDSPKTESFLHLQSLPSQPIRIIPAVSTRVRYSRLNTYSQRPRTIASLDFEVTPFIRFDVELDVAQVSLSDDGTIEPITSIELPVKCRSRDDVTFLYNLTPSERHIGPTSSTASVVTLEIYLFARLLVSSTCIPRISMRWRSSVDFSLPVNPSYGAPSQMLQRNHRPTNLPTIPTATLAASGTTSSLMTTSPDTSLTISFIANLAPIQLGSIFTWNVLVYNHSPRSRKLTLVAVTSRSSRVLQSNSTANSIKEHSHHDPKGSITSQISISSAPKSSITASSAQDLAPAFLDENVLYAIQRSSVANNSSNSTPLVCVSPDIRIGPLGSGGAHECEMKFLALHAGWTKLEAIRVIDIGASERQSVASQGPGEANPVEWVVRDLPDIWVVDDMRGI